ncbi:hypothetical protein PN419_00105 [Halorubrum ezzemoulense]|uniref:hypothetical protein n=1 Tax=Halorubrum ezzemoulense TaxID=337243 RepID=UPI00232E23E4|nr:hypothetical protein [Halorubrum ezzemoulense]MDB9247409.1 hypothetical protein [Halorubrum ezzemoulense]MDB9258682.1 hypothetical protein [Halorubrum ezzemoulense]MDB9264460.1 hypothetical protein [Halorubrum ezzemoulense]MDB9269043.1 hypothetical protein [Halorubrum ezzemoulense]MDB9271428.1 hypothetical protein [Halorubrum ezzemoulense]
MNSELSVADTAVFNGEIHVIVEHQQYGRRYRYDGQIGDDRVVQPLSMTGYDPHDAVDTDLAEQGKALAERHINEETPFSMYEGERTYYQPSPTLRGLKYNQKQTLRSLTDAEKRELLNRVQSGDIVLTAEVDDDE